MRIRQEVQDLISLGQMPNEDAEEEDIERWLNMFRRIVKPATDNEARALAQCFPPDMGYGVGWSLLHLVETTPGWVRAIAETINDADWREEALARLANVGR